MIEILDKKFELKENKHCNRCAYTCSYCEPSFRNDFRTVFPRQVFLSWHTASHNGQGLRHLGNNKRQTNRICSRTNENLSTAHGFSQIPCSYRCRTGRVTMKLWLSVPLTASNVNSVGFSASFYLKSNCKNTELSLPLPKQINNSTCYE